MFEKKSAIKAELERNNQQLQACTERIRTIMNKSRHGILIVDTAKTIRFANPAATAIFACTWEELMGKQFEYLIEPDKTSELKIKTRDGKTVTVEMWGVETEWNSCQAWFVSLHDVTERKRAEEEIERLNTDLAARAAELETANRELEAFNYTVAHDLRKPLTVVNSYCQAIRELCGDKLDEACKGYLREAYDGTLRMNRLIDALLSFSRLAHVETRRETIDLSAMAHEVAAELKLAEPERRVKFLIANGVSAYGDAPLLRTVLDNLLGNAWKYTGTRDEGSIEFGTTEIDGKTVHFVRDNGTGFDMADADKLFTPFQRLPGAEECRGFGIGLATVERIIRRHGGKVWAEGEPGKGATFFFTLSGKRTI